MFEARSVIDIPCGYPDVPRYSTSSQHSASVSVTLSVKTCTVNVVLLVESTQVSIQSDSSGKQNLAADDDTSFELVEVVPSQPPPVRTTTVSVVTVPSYL